MEKILIYENDSISEYEVCFDQEYMDTCLEEYRKTFALLRKGRVFLDKDFSNGSLRKVVGGINEFVSVNIYDCPEEDCFCLSYVGAINPTVYNILSCDKKFVLDTSRIHALYAWYQAIKDNAIDGKRDLLLASFDYFNLDERLSLKENISSLLSDVTLVYTGKKESERHEDLINARRNSIFVDEFGMKKEHILQLKK